MKKITLTIVVLISLAMVAGYASTRFRKPQVSFTPHTIIYRATGYDESGNESETSIVVRRVFADGKWKHTQILSNGKVLFSNGQLKGPITSKTTDTNSPECLHYKYVEEDNRGTQTWVSPELQDYLKLIVLGSKGEKQSQLEALDVSAP